MKHTRHSARERVQILVRIHEQFTSSTASVMPDASSAPAHRHGSSFDTLRRENNFKFPPVKGSVAPILDEFVAPHLESFNALFDDSGLPAGDGDHSGQLSLSIKDIGEHTVFDGKGQIGLESGQTGWGNRLSSMSMFTIASWLPSLNSA